MWNKKRLCFGVPSTTLGISILLKERRSFKQKVAMKADAPALKNRSIAIDAIVSYIYITDHLPTEEMFHSFWRILKDRIKCIWHEAEMVAVLREEVPAYENNQSDSLLVE